MTAIKKKQPLVAQHGATMKNRIPSLKPVHSQHRTAGKILPPSVPDVQLSDTQAGSGRKKKKSLGSSEKGEGLQTVTDHLRLAKLLFTANSSTWAINKAGVRTLKRVAASNLVTQKENEIYKAICRRKSRIFRLVCRQGTHSCSGAAPRSRYHITEGRLTHCAQFFHDFFDVPAVQCTGAHVINICQIRLSYNYPPFILPCTFLWFISPPTVLGKPRRYTRRCCVQLNRERWCGRTLLSQTSYHGDGYQTEADVS